MRIFKHQIHFFELIALIFVLIGTGQSCFSGRNKPEITIRIDPRMELLAVIQVLSKYDNETGLLTKLDFAYKREIVNYFSSYSSHRAIQIFENICGKFSYDAPPKLMTQLGDPPALELRHEYGEYLISRADGRDNLSDFVAAMREFARATRFMEFFNSHRDLFRSIEKDIGDKLGNHDYLGPLENYFGTRQNSYTFIAVPLFHGGGFASWVPSGNNNFDVFYIGGPTRVENDKPIFHTEASIRDIASHEFGHSFVNPESEKYEIELKRSSSLLQPILSLMNRNGYADWLACVNEHVLRAVAIRITASEVGCEKSDEELKKNKLRGFFYLEPILTKLKDYETHREKYPRFSDFYPEIVKELQKLSESELGDDFYWMPFDGTENSVLFQNKSLVVVLPTNEADKKNQEWLHFKYRSQFEKHPTKVITDTEALKNDLSSNFLIVIGTMEGNLWLKKYAIILPFSMFPDKLVADREYPGTEIRFKTTWPNPENPEKGMLILTAQNTFNLLRCGDVGSGSTDYTVIDGWKVIKYGYYKKEGKKWSF